MGLGYQEKMGLPTIWDRLGQVAAVALAFAIPISTTLTTIFASIALGAWLIGGNWAIKKDLFLHHPATKWIYPLIIITFMGVSYSQAETQSILRSLYYSSRLLFIPLLIYFYQDKKIAHMALWAFVGAMCITLLFAFLKMYAGFPIGLKYHAGAVFKSHIKTSFFMAMAAFFLAFELKKKSKYRLLYFTLVLLMAYYLLFMNVGRIGYITFFLSLCFLAWHWFGGKGLFCALFIAIFGIGSVYFTSNLFADRINLLSHEFELYQGGRLIESSLGSRLQFAITSGQLIMEKPLLGHGTGSFGLAYAQKHPEKKALLTDNPHNEFLRFGVELGGLGLILLMMLFRWQWQLAKLLDRDHQALCRGVILAFVIGCLLNSWLKDFTEAYFYCVMMAVFFSLVPHAKMARVFVSKPQEVLCQT